MMRGLPSRRTHSLLFASCSTVTASDTHFLSFLSPYSSWKKPISRPVDPNSFWASSLWSSRSFTNSVCQTLTPATVVASSVAAMASSQDFGDVSKDAIITEIIETGFLSSKMAAALDEELMSTPGFSLEQLMELAGLSVAEAVHQVAYDSQDQRHSENVGRTKKHVLLVCGPGNNGGDGLVAARHLVHFGLEATIVYPKPSSKIHFINLVKQCEDVGIQILSQMPEFEHNASKTDTKYDIIVDAIFGFSFHGTAPREPFATAIASMIQLQKEQQSILISVDVPSGWDVDGGDLTGKNFYPDVLVSLTAPKLLVKKFQGRHFVGGRFLPPAMAEKYGIKMPPYPGVSQVMEIL